MAVPNPTDPNLPFSNAAADLGQGWKVNPFLKVKPHGTVTIMDVPGPGVIQHMWMATAPNWKGNGRASYYVSTGITRKLLPSRLQCPIFLR